MNDTHDTRAALLGRLNREAPSTGQWRHVADEPFGQALQVERYELGNGLTLLYVLDDSAPVVAYHTWFRVGSRHERPGKTGIAHLFEHLMFNETENLPAGEFDRRLEQAGAESNASTWLDWTQYNVAVPRDAFDLVVELEADRMENLVLRDPQVSSEKEVVANERRYRVEDDVEGAVSELLWKTAYERHSYRWPTIGWMEDILGFTTQDCEAFYRTYYAPNNATVVVVGDVPRERVLEQIARRYGHLSAANLPPEESEPEPEQSRERRVETTKPTPTEKVMAGYHGPPIADDDHLALSILVEVLFGGRASRVVKRLVREEELASEARMFVGPFEHPCLLELFANARGEHTGEELLAVVDDEIERVKSAPIPQDEIDRTLARFELYLLGGLETADAKANTIGFYYTVLRAPSAAFDRLEAARSLTPDALQRVGRKYLRTDNRSVVMVRRSGEAQAAEEATP